MGRGPAHHRPTRENPARPIANIFVFTGDIGDRGRGQEHKGRSEQLQGTDGGGEEMRRGGGWERRMEREEQQRHGHRDKVGRVGTHTGTQL